MKKNILASALLAVLSFCSLTAYSASDRLDFYKKDGSFVSFMTEEIQKITYIPSADGETFTGIQILMFNNETKTLNIADYTEIKYEGIATDWLEIARINDEHSRVIMLDCINNDHIMSPDKPLDWTADKPNGTPHFLYKADPGFDATLAVEGQYTGTVYSDRDGFVFWSEKTDNLIGRDCWAFFMPNEPVNIKTKATERTTYLGKDFVGVYKGYYIHSDQTLTVSSDQPTLTLELKSNESYTVKSTDENKFDVIDLYTFNEENQTFEYQYIPREESDMGDYTVYYGVIGKMIDGFCFVDMVNKTEDKPENVRRYCIAKDGFNMDYAVSDTWGTKYLLEAVKDDGTKKYFFLDNYGNLVKAATLQFIKGEKILAEGSKAIISYDGNTQWMYAFENNAPKFIAKGKEAGTYKPMSGEGKELILDGFGNATLEGKECTYTAEGMIITTNADSNLRFFILDIANNTYKEMISDEWNGPDAYENKAVAGQFQGEAGTDNTVRLLLNKNLMGYDEPGKAALQVSMRNDFGSFTDIVAAVEKYIYDATAKTITITNVLMGDANGFNGRKNITFKLSDDLTKAYLEGEGENVRIYQAAIPANYVEVNLENALTGEMPANALAAKYEGEITLLYYSSPMPAQKLSLWIDQDTTGAEKAGFATLKLKAMGTDFFNTCVEYVHESNKLRLKGVTVGDGNYGSKQEDIVFTIETDGSLQGSGKYFGSVMDTAFMEADFSTCKLTAVNE